MLTDQLRADLATSMKNRDATTTGALRLGLAAIAEAAVAGKEAKELDDTEVLRVLTKAARKHEEAAEAFDAAGRTDRAEQERAAHAVLAAYLPKALTEAELGELVTATLAGHGFTSPKDMGAAMKAVNAQVAGRAEGKVVANLVKGALGA